MEPVEPSPEAESLAPAQVAAVVSMSERIGENIRRAVKVRDEQLNHMIVSLLAEGHVLIEDYPGVGKTALARALSRSIECQFARVQCTADPLPEAQVDRFMVRLSLGYPDAADEAGMLAGHEAGDRVLDLGPVTDRAEVLEAVEAAHRVHASRALRDYIVALLRHTRADGRVELGASPRAGLLLLRAAKARALIQGRDHALPDDVQALADTVLTHRIMLVPEAAGVERSAIVADAIAATPAL